MGLTIEQIGTTAITTSKVTRDGQCVVEIHDNGAKLSITKTFITLTAPIWLSTTPPLPAGYTLVDVSFDQFAAAGKAAVYGLANDGTNSIVFYNPDSLGGGAWSQGATVSGVYTALRCGNVDGKILIYSPGNTSGAGPWSHDFDFTLNNQGFSARGFGSYSGNRWNGVLSGSDTLLAIVRAISVNTTITNIRIVGFAQSASSGGARGPWDGTTGYTTDGPNGAGAFDFTDTRTLTNPSAVGYNIDTSGGGLTTNYITRMVVSGTGVDPWTALATVLYSSNRGAAFGAPVEVGAATGLATGGFDTARASGVSVAACGHAITRATTLGGAYSALATFSGSQVTCAVLPYYRIGSDVTSQTTSSTPDVLVGLDTPESGTCLFKVDGSGTKTAITTPAVGAIVPNQHAITLLRGSKMAVVVNVSGTYKLYVTENLAADGTCTWSYVQDVTVRASVRVRRNDARNKAHSGQLFLWDTTADGYSSQFAYNGSYPRIGPVGIAVAGDVLG